MSSELLDPDKCDGEDGRPTKGSDCYALGMVIYEVLRSKAPFAPLKGFIVMRKILEGERSRIPEGAEGAWFADDLWGTLNLCWAIDQKTDLVLRPYLSVWSSFRGLGTHPPLKWMKMQRSMMTMIGILC